MHTRTLSPWLIALAALLGTATAAVPAPEAAQESDFRLRFVGPKVGNRIASVAGIAGDPSVYYAGAASGGVWKSTDGGNRWLPIFDKQTVAAIGAAERRRNRWSTIALWVIAALLAWAILLG